MSFLETICNILCRLNIPCQIAIKLGFDGLCLSFNLPCLPYLLEHMSLTKEIRKSPLATILTPFFEG